MKVYNNDIENVPNYYGWNKGSVSHTVSVIPLTLWNLTLKLNNVVVDGNSVVKSDQFDNKYIREYSRGNKQKIGITGALFAEPEFVILDEPFNHLDPTSRILLEQIIKNYNKNKRTSMIISSHDIAHITNIADKVVLLENGSIKNIFTDMSIVKEELISYFTPDNQTVNVEA
jgi:ABC-type multidrug transport system ATPase subunit